MLCRHIVANNRRGNELFKQYAFVQDPLIM